jgi:HAD superfamily hydrolase (TIGR01509 family)
MDFFSRLFYSWHMIKYLIFDWGGVCTHGHLLKDFAKNLSAKTGIDENEIEIIFREAEYPYETGKISPDEFWQQFYYKFKPNISREKTMGIFLNSYRLNKDVLDFILELRKDHKIVLFTNNYEDMFIFMKNNYNLDKYFDYVFSSSDMKNKKPEAEAYRYLLSKLRIEPREAVFIDDKERNIIGAKDAGIRTILFENLTKLKQDISIELF